MRPNSKGRILKAATIEFSSRGFDSVTIKDIAKRAKVSPGNIYVFYKDKATLLNEAVSDYMQKVQLLCRKSPAGDSEFYGQMISIASEDKYSMQCVINTPSEREKLVGYLTKEILRGCTEGKKESSSFRKLNARIAASATVTMVMEIIDHEKAYQSEHVQPGVLLEKTVSEIMCASEKAN